MEEGLPAEPLKREYTRRQILSGMLGVAAIGAAGYLSTSSDPTRISNAVSSIIHSPELRRAEIALRRSKYGITESISNQDVLDDELANGQVEMQKYKLSCEFRSVAYMLLVDGINKKDGSPFTEDDLIDKTPASPFPWVGHHPDLKKEPFDKSKAYAEIPPQPYGIFPAPLAEMLNTDILPSTLEAEHWDNKTIRGGRPEYEDRIRQNLNNGLPMAAWFNNAPNYKNVEVTTIGPDTVAPHQHTLLITGIGANNIETLDPTNNEEYMYYPIEEFYERAKLSGLGLLSITPTDLAEKHS